MGEVKKKNKWLSFLADGLISGVMIGIGGIVSLSCDNRYLGAFLFSLGLFAIIHFQYGLYTGKVGYILDRDAAYVGETFFTLLSNGIGTALAAGLIHLTRFARDVKVSGMDLSLMERAQASIASKFSDNPVSMLVLAVFCGLMMFTAVEGCRKCTAKNDHAAALFVVILPIMVFILSGFNHCVADLFYYFLAGCPLPQRALIYFPLVILGNLIGGVAVPLLKWLSNHPLS